MPNAPRTIDCSGVIRLLFEYLDNELERHDHMAVEVHLYDCRACFSRMQFDKRLKGMVKGTDTASSPDALRDRITKMTELF